MNQPVAIPAKKIPVLTLVLMACCLITALLLVDWNGSGSARPLWLLFLPVVLGVAGAVNAVLRRKIFWAVASAALGLFIVQILVVLVTLIAGL